MRKGVSSFVFFFDASGQKKIRERNRIKLLKENFNSRKDIPCLISSCKENNVRHDDKRCSFAPVYFCDNDINHNLTSMHGEHEVTSAKIITVFPTARI